MSKDSAQIRDQLGLDPDVVPFIVPDYDETIKITEGPIKAQKYSIGNSWIVGSSTNGKVGTNTSTANGLQQYVGAQGRTYTLQWIKNTNNIYKEPFLTTDYKDAVSSTGTARWGSGTARVLDTQVLQSKTIYRDVGTVTSATMTVIYEDNSIWGTLSGSATLAMSANGTATAFETVSNNTSYSFTNQGRDLRWKITGTGTASLRRMTIAYNLTTG